ncbi:MAG: helix-turn-helix transcriptional regulator [Anaerolineae bacterium]|jgi:DNA-binding HxlR family transcriptional regulator|nr:helix-turn-helix transcriptional regulator [Anaerolineae bacterium]
MPKQPLYILDSTCHTRKALELIGDKWTVLLLHAINTQTLRYSELKRIVEGITHKMLAQTLRQLEHDGLVERTVYPVIPPKVEYRLTPLGQTLLPILGQLCGWAEQYFPAVLASRQQASDMSETDSRYVEPHALMD